MDELIKSCDYCGYGASVNGSLEGHYYVECDRNECQASGPMKDTPEEAITVWNKNASLGQERTAAERETWQWVKKYTAIEEERDAIALKLTREWQQVIAAIAGDVMECLETVKELELNVPGHPFYHGKMSVLMHFRQMADADEQKYLAGASIVAENERLLALLASFRAAHAALRAAQNAYAKQENQETLAALHAAEQAYAAALGRLVG